MQKNLKYLASRMIPSPALPGLLAGCLCAAALTGCRTGSFTSCVSPQVTGRVLAADTGQPLDGVTVRRVLPMMTAGEDTAPKGGQLLMQPGGARTDADGRFVLDGERAFSLFRRGGWSSITVSFSRAGYTGFQTNYIPAESKEQGPGGVSWLNVGDVMLQPRQK
jgi:hypothetical protein